MKKIIALLLAMIMLFSLAACGKQNADPAPEQPAPTEPETPDVPASGSDLPAEESKDAPIDSIPVDTITTLFMDMYEGEGVSGCMNETLDQGVVANLIGAESFEGEFEAAQGLVPMMMTAPFVLIVFRLVEGADAEAFAADLKAKANPAKWICVQADNVETVVSGRTVLFYMCPAVMKDGLNSVFAEMCEDGFVPEDHFYKPLEGLDMTGLYTKLLEFFGDEWGFMDNADIVTAADLLSNGGYGLTGIDSALYTDALLDDGYKAADDMDGERSYVLALYRLAEGVNAAEFTANAMAMLDTSALKGTEPEEPWTAAAYSDDVVVIFAGGGSYAYSAGGLESILTMDYRMTSATAGAGGMMMR